MIPKELKGIPGLMTGPELAVLTRMARSAGSAVELGCFHGRSLAAMGLEHPGMRLWGVDAWGDMSHRGYQGATLEACRANLERLGVRAELLQGKTEEVAPEFGETVELVHVDAGHSYEECTRDLADWTPKVGPGGALCVHDYGEPHNPALSRPEVREAVDDWRNSDWAEVERDGVMIAFRRLIADRGALYVAYGERAREQCLESIDSLHAVAPALPVAVVSDAPLEGADHMIIHPEADRGARAQKTRMYSLSPFRETLFLDADTRVLVDPEPGFGLLRYADVVLSQDPVRVFSQQTWPHLDRREVAATRQETNGGELLYWNSGVILFRRSERARALFQAWHAEWTRWGKHDQMALMRAVYRNPVRMVAVREPWNTHKRKEAKFVFHDHRAARREGAPQ
ncbi:MAG: hypothetical protein GX649_00490 [Chloroflexi bacterium]|nr:hypothetical protein [Chloroflexota bacterium]